MPQMGRSITEYVSSGQEGREFNRQDVSVARRCELNKSGYEVPIIHGGILKDFGQRRDVVGL